MSIPPMALQASNRLNNEDWESKRGVLERLYSRENQSMREVMIYMKNKHGWEAKPNQYEKWLVKTWKLCKNVDSLTWKIIIPHVLAIERGGKQAKVLIDGREIAAKTVAKETQRYLRTCPGLEDQLPQTLPKGVVVRPVIFIAMTRITTDLPFRCFESHIFNTRPIIARRNQGVAGLQDARTRIIDTTTWSPDHVIENALQAVVPQDQHADESLDLPLMTSGTHVFASPLHRAILFSISNNFAGLNAFSKEQVIGFLQHETSERLYRMMRSASHFYTVQAIALNLFRAAIEIGDAGIVSYVLGEPLAKIQINAFICSHEGKRFSPIVKAAMTLHKDVVRVLLKHGADVNVVRSSDPYCQGALHCALEAAYRYSRVTQAGIDPELFEMLLQAGGNAGFHPLRSDDDSPLEQAIKHDVDGHLVRLLIAAQGAYSQHPWSPWKRMNTYALIFRYHNHDISLDAFRIMRKHHTDLNMNSFKVVGDRSRFKVGRIRLIDITAERGNIELTKLLLEEGARLTGDTLPCAISSGDEGLVRFLLDRGAKLDSMGSLEISPLAAAIRLQHQDLLYHIKMLSLPSCLSNCKLIESATTAAAEVGDLMWLRYLIDFENGIQPKNLNKALVAAIRHGHEDAALMLIGAGASCALHPPGGDFCGPLHEALKQQNPVLVRAILEADADPSEDTQAVGLAVIWGEISIVKELIEAGATISAHHGQQALYVAVERRSKAIVELLLDSGCSIQNTSNSDTGLLSIAVKTGDVDMISYLLSKGVDPHDPYAFQEAAKQEPAVLALLLREHAARYPKGRAGWAVHILIVAIQSGDFPLFKRLLDRGADATALCGPRSPLLDILVVAKGGDIRFLEYLLQHKEATKISPETIVTTTGHQPYARVTALLAAIGTGSRAVVELLFRHKADVNSPTGFGVKRTPLQRAVEMGSMELIKFLLEQGADVNGPAAQRAGGTALQFAAIKGIIPIARLLLEKGAHVDAPASKADGRTALEGAAWQGRLDMVVMLLKAGAARGGNDQRQLTRAIAFAEEDGHSHIAHLIGCYARDRTISEGQFLFEELVDYESYQNGF